MNNSLNHQSGNRQGYNRRNQPSNRSIYTQQPKFVNFRTFLDNYELFNQTIPMNYQNDNIPGKKVFSNQNVTNYSNYGPMNNNSLGMQVNYNNYDPYINNVNTDEILMYQQMSKYRIFL
jgi:hypothetical protein